ncbi:hypothetical protein J2R98_001441 [Alkalibacillus filiformis]|uniref:Uncharacterized protein n=1 Tax=Alkalibacillus filiformis TaxID=200990 RepID=A0ABU0DTG0_9BACI|nr:hypothetical protein [Alkalibacillus filiformis]MDQ0351624.1 hypothetical protein [Alkalibacillus filiformis]
MKYDSRYYLHGHKSIDHVKQNSQRYNTSTNSLDTYKLLKVQDVVKLLNNYKKAHQDNGSFQSKHIHMRNTLLNHFRTRQSFEESLEYKQVHHINKMEQQIQVLLIDLSKSMRSLKSLTLINLMKDQENHPVLYHREQLVNYDPNQLLLEDFQGGTSVAAPLKMLLKVEHLIGSKLNITHISDGDVSTKEWEKACNIINQLRGTYELLLTKPLSYSSLIKILLEENDIKYTLLAHNIGE